MDDIYKSSYLKCLQGLSKWDNFIKSNLDGTELDTETNKLKGTLEQLCIIDNEHDAAQNVIQSFEENMHDLLAVDDIKEIFNNKMKNQPKKPVQSNEAWKKIFSQDIEEIEPKIKKRKTRNYENIDDSIMCSSSFTIPIDPISKRPIRKPLRNKTCHHIYDKDSIYGYIKQSKSKARCPYVGCIVNKLNTNDLQIDVELEQKIQRHLEQQDNTSEGESD